jgi:hypothetical protein
MSTAPAITWDSDNQVYIVNDIVVARTMWEVLALLSDDESPRQVTSTPVCVTNPVLLSTRWELLA